ncbi:TMEM175 family protein [Cognataquiflexum rubidum]|uniref:TMEM175 family protein n=1 Tax=Cognataquiflexum rubidum TaxID=2922273 RepID=UPI001F1427D0|nr:TMEM175 family protein [Cognataquiflexum rubidum]MCH6233360.1 TMEM175 family protein [Cognataquiflexum rubidum]
MRNEILKNKQHDPRINYRGENASRFDNLTDAVFGIAITLLIFNLANPNSFEDLLTFTKTLPAFLISISFIILIWNEHLDFSEVYSLNDTRLTILNTIFIALVIFYVYPLRFLTLFLTNFFFKTDIAVNIQGDQVPLLMIYYGFVAFALYFILFLFYHRAYKMKGDLNFNQFEEFYTESQKIRLLIMFSVPLLSITLTLILKEFSFIWASVIGGVTYCLYTPLIILWYKKFQSKSKEFGEI